MLIDGIAGLAATTAPVVVVGSGPVGLAVATRLRSHGVPVTVLESGGRGRSPTVQALSAAERVAPERHDDMAIAVARQLGGTSNLWGARCLPYDPVDFVPRHGIDARWPIGHDALAPYWAPAVTATQSGSPVFVAAEPLLPGGDTAFSADALERWANVQAAQVIHRHAIAGDPGLEVRTHATLVGISFAEAGEVAAIEVAHSLSGERVRLTPARVVIATGGLETARLLLAARRDSPARFGDALGRYYMAHVIGEIADLIFADHRYAAAFDFWVDPHGSYARRRFSPSEALQREHGLLNSAFWPVVAPIADARHGSAILSMVYLALKTPGLGPLLTAEAIRRRHVSDEPAPLLPHLANLVTGLPQAALFGTRFLRDRYLRAERMPGFFVRNGAHRYRLSYHGEHAPDRDSRVWLDGTADRLGLPSLVIDLRFGDRDVDSLVRTHDLLEAWLAATRVGRIEYRFPREDRAAAIMRLAAHGTHQIGLARMGDDRRHAVVDGDLRCFDSANLYLAGSAVLPTSSQANPTLTAVALGIRLADRLADEIARPLTVSAPRPAAVGADG